jgi:hypothetical protein
MCSAVEVGFAAYPEDIAMASPVRIALTALVCLVAFATASARGADSPLQKAAVGDFVEFRSAQGNVYVRYTVKAKTDKTATLTVKSWSGELEMGEREVELPLAGSLDLQKLVPTSDDKVEVKFDKEVPNLKYKVKSKEFAGTAYTYKMNVDLFGSLLSAVKGADDKAEDKATDEGKLEMTIAYFVSPEAPVLGLVAIAFKGGFPLRLELSDGTGVADMLYPPVKNPSPSEKAQAGEWLEYHGTNEPDGRKVVLRHEVKEKEGDKAILTGKLLIDGALAEEWEFALPRAKKTDFIPLWRELGDLRGPYSFSDVGSVKKKVTILDDVKLQGEEDAYSITFTEGKERKLLQVGITTASELPLTRIAQISLKRQPTINVTLTLVGHSGIVEVKAKPATKTKAAPKRTPVRKKADKGN